MQSKIGAAHYDLYDCGRWCGQTDMKHRYRDLFAHQPGYRETHTKRPDDTLQHHKSRIAADIETADKAEPKWRRETVNGIGFQVVRSR